METHREVSVCNSAKDVCQRGVVWAGEEMVIIQSCNLGQG